MAAGLVGAFCKIAADMLPLRRIIVAELRRLGADTVRLDENGGRRHPRIVATFAGRELETVVPRGNVPDRCHIKRNYIAQTRKSVRAFLQRGRSA
jgi:hypothetical protein